MKSKGFISPLHEVEPLYKNPQINPENEKSILFQNLAAESL